VQTLITLIPYDIIIDLPGRFPCNVPLVENLISWGTFSLNAPVRLSRRERPYLYNNWLNSGSGYPWRTVASNQPNFGFLCFNAGQHWNYLVIVMDRNVARSLFRNRSRCRSRHDSSRASHRSRSCASLFFFSPPFFPFPSSAIIEPVANLIF